MSDVVGRALGTEFIWSSWQLCEVAATLIIPVRKSGNRYREVKEFGQSHLVRDRTGI